MVEEEHDEPRPSEHRKLTVVEREREWLAKQFSKEREAYWEKDTKSPMELLVRLNGPLNSARVDRQLASSETCLG